LGSSRAKADGLTWDQRAGKSWIVRLLIIISCLFGLQMREKLLIVFVGYLKEGWLSEGEAAGPNGEKHVQSFVINEKAGWTGEQIWGFIQIDGVRYYARRVIVIKGDKAMRVRMVYDWHGKE
jgi:hypothetical protein